MPTKRRRSPRELSLSWNQGLHLVAEVAPVDGFVDVISLQLLTNRDHLVLRFDSRDHVLLLLEAVLALFDGLDQASSFVHTRVFKLD